MPMYDYICGDCGEAFELYVKRSSVGDTIYCQTCGSIANRVPSLSSFVLKGGGWESDGYQKNGGKNND